MGVRWPMDKKRWCCKHKVLGCASSLGPHSRFERAVMASPLTSFIFILVILTLSAVLLARFCTFAMVARHAGRDMDVLTCLDPQKQQEFEPDTTSTIEDSTVECEIHG